MLVCKIFRCAIIELFTAIVTEYNPRKHTDISTASGSALVFAKLLDNGKGFSVNDGRVSILEYLPIFFGNVYPRFVLERLGGVTEIDRISPHIPASPRGLQPFLLPTFREQRAGRNIYAQRLSNAP